LLLVEVVEVVEHLLVEVEVDLMVVLEAEELEV
jgi:hypothetical protein